MRPPVPSGTVFIKDTVDVWGEEKTLGLAELGVRVHAPPMMFDRRGDVVRWVNFESATPNFSIITIGSPTYGRSTDVAFTGDFSYKINCKSTDPVAIYLHANDFHIGKIGSQMMFSADDENIWVYIDVTHYDGTNRNYAQLWYSGSDGKINIKDGSTGLFVEIGIAKYHADIHDFSTIKLVIDTDTGYYTRALVHGNEYDISSYELQIVGAPTTPPYVKSVNTLMSSETLTAHTLYVDNIILTENEPT